MQGDRYKTTIDRHYETRLGTSLRARRTIALLPQFDHPVSVLDTGDRTSITAQLEKLWDCPVANTSGDLDTARLTGSYDVITSFEVLEHLYNPLHNLLEIHRVLKPNGYLFLTTPCGKPHFLWSKDHFHEMFTRELESLVQRAGFRIERKVVFRVHPWWFYFSGIRPLLRFIYDQRLFLALIPK